MTLERVLVGVDGGAASIAAVRAAMELVAPTGELRLARVVTSSLARRALDLVTSGGSLQAFRAQRRATAEESLAQLTEVIGAQTPAGVTAAVLEGRVADALVQASVDQGSELVVIGDRRPRRLHRRFFGGVVRRLIERSDVPTLVVPEFAVLHRVHGALVLAPAPPADDELRDVQRILGPLRPSYEFMATGLGPYRGLNHCLEATTSRTVLVVSRRTALQDLGATWLLDHAPGPVLFVPTGGDADVARDRLAAFAAWHGDVPGRTAVDTEEGEATTPAAREGLPAEAAT